MLVEQLGGRWVRGGDAGEYAPCQLAYRDDMRLEIISLPSPGGGFMRRFLDRSGPGPHHITVAVPSLDAALAAVAAWVSPRSTAAGVSVTSRVLAILGAFDACGGPERLQSG